MPVEYKGLFTDSFLAQRWAAEFQQYQATNADPILLRRLQNWASKPDQKETTAEGPFVSVFFEETWGYRPAGKGAADTGYTCISQHAVQGAGQGGGTGQADLVLGWFGHTGVSETPQAMCEFKDIRSALDSAQRRKGNTRSPVKQCFDYLREARDRIWETDPIQPTWCVVSDMNEFRLYSRKSGTSQSQRFILNTRPGDSTPCLLEESDEALFQRFVFSRVFHSDLLLTTAGPSRLLKLLEAQGAHEKDLENEFYGKYRAYREELYNGIVAANPVFPSTRGRLVRLTQRLLDRCIFAMFCEDMGARLSFPPNLFKEILAEHSKDPDYDPDDNGAWNRVKRLFVSMRDGTRFRDRYEINKFNGGLFETDEQLENLNVPTRLFCARNQGASPAETEAHKKTLLFFCATYNFGLRGATQERSIGLYTLGRIFEQSITELEYMEAKADDRPSLTEISERKRNGVYYTPEHITEYLVRETLGVRLAELKTEVGLAGLAFPTAAEITTYRETKKPDKRMTAAGRYLDALDAYETALTTLTVVDPSCGSGAFLIQAFNLLISERRTIVEEKNGILAQRSLFDQDAIMRQILSTNLFGVDINQESVEITKLSLWLQTAQANRPLSSLGHNIVCGNSLVEKDFESREKQFEIFGQEMAEEIQGYTRDEIERVNAFAWDEVFPDVFARGGFDCVIGNPPYVKLQHYLQVQPATTAYLRNARDGTGHLRYPSFQTGNPDMYLAFIERGIRLLNPSGRMGYIAPSVWAVNDYGRGLRKEIRQSRQLDRWIDFLGFQVFDEALTYTALQFFRRDPSDGIKCVVASDGSIEGIEWGEHVSPIPYDELSEDEPWLMRTKQDRDLITKLGGRCGRLGDRTLTTHVFQGIITSADHIYHLKRMGNNRYQHSPKRGEPYDVEIEDALMRPVISGPETKRFQVPATDTYLLFPYAVVNDEDRLYTPAEMSEQFPHGWAYLRTHEDELRARESRSFDDERWYRFGRPQNIDKQHRMKLCVAQTVPEMRVCLDERGDFCINNVRVNGIFPTHPEDNWYLLGMLNCPVVNYVFRRIAKPKEGGYFEANKQFIEPLPIPTATPELKASVSTTAKELQRLHTNRRDAILRIAHRLESAQTEDDTRDYEWMWADVRTRDKWEAEAPSSMRTREKARWAKKQYEHRLEARLESVQVRLTSGVSLDASFENGELRFFVGGVQVIEGVFLGPEDGDFIAAQWRQVARSSSVTERFTAARLIDRLRGLRKTASIPLMRQVIEADEVVSGLDQEIRNAEKQLSDTTLALYGELSPEEIALIVKDRL